MEVDKAKELRTANNQFDFEQKDSIVLTLLKRGKNEHPFSWPKPTISYHKDVIFGKTVDPLSHRCDITTL